MYSISRFGRKAASAILIQSLNAMQIILWNILSAKHSTFSVSDSISTVQTRTPNDESHKFDSDAFILSIASRHSCRGWPTYQGEAVLRPVHVWNCAEPDQDVRGGPDLAGPASRQWRHEYWRMLWVPSSVERDSVCVLYAGQGKRVFHRVSVMLSVEPNLLNFRTILDKTLDF